MTRRYADPFAAVLDALDRRAKKTAAATPIMCTVVSNDPFTIELDTGQVIPNPMVLLTISAAPSGGSS